MALPASAERSSHRPVLVRVTVIGATGRIDLALPGAVPVVSMVADLIQLLGMETAESHLVVTTTGVVLDANRGLSEQGIGDGAILTLAPVREHVPHEVYDDIVEAVHSLARGEFTSWGRDSATASACAASVWSLGLGATLLTAVGVLHPQAGMVAGVVAGAGALALLLVAALRTPASTAPGPEWRAVVAAWFACLYAALAGAVVAGSQQLGSGQWPASDRSVFGPMLWAALSALGAAGVACVVLRRNRLLVGPVMLLGAVVVMSALVATSGVMTAGHWVAVVATVWILAGRMAPGLAMEATVLRGTVTSRRDTSGGVTTGVDTDRLRTDLAVSHDMVLAASLSSAGLLLLAVPTALTNGLVGLLWLICLTGVIALRLRRVRLRTEVVVGLVGLGLVTTAIVGGSVVLPSGLMVVLAGVLLAVGIVVGLSGGRAASLRVGWLGDRIEVLLTAACVPLCVAVVWPTLLPGG